MPRVLTDYQWIILWEIEDHPQGVWCRADQWFKRMGTRDIKITDQVEVLLWRQLIRRTDDSQESVLEVTELGREALARRDYMTVIDRFNSK